VSTTLGICSNNGIIGVVGTSGLEKLSWVRERAAELDKDLLAAGKSVYSVNTFDIAYAEVGRIPVATFVNDREMGNLTGSVTGNKQDYEDLLVASEASIVPTSFGVPFSNGLHMSRPEDKITLSELLEIFGLSSLMATQLVHI
jgi:hypothetical protein